METGEECVKGGAENCNRQLSEDLAKAGSENWNFGSDKTDSFN